MVSDWALLPLHLVESVLKKIESVRDYLQFDVVWHLAAKCKQRERILKKLYHQFPMLLMPSAENHSRTMYNVATGSFLDSKLVVLCHSISVSLALQKVRRLHRDTPQSLVNGSRGKESQDYDIFEASYNVNKALITANPINKSRSMRSFGDILSN